MAARHPADTQPLLANAGKTPLGSRPAPGAAYENWGYGGHLHQGGYGSVTSRAGYHPYSGQSSYQSAGGQSGGSVDYVQRCWNKMVAEEGRGGGRGGGAHTADGLPQGAYPPQELPQGAYPPQELPQGAYPPQELPQGAYPPQELPQGAYPPQDLPQGAYPPQELPQGAYPPQELPQGAYPPQELPQGAYPPQELPQGAYPPPSSNPAQPPLDLENAYRPPSNSTTSRPAQPPQEQDNDGYPLNRQQPLHQDPPVEPVYPLQPGQDRAQQAPAPVDPTYPVPMGNGQNPVYPTGPVIVNQPRTTPSVYIHPYVDDSYKRTKFECNSDFYRNQLCIAAVFVVCGILCINLVILPCAVVACISAMKTAEANKRGIVDDAKHHHKRAKFCNITTAILSVIAGISLFFGLILFVEYIVRQINGNHYNTL